MNIKSTSKENKIAFLIVIALFLVALVWYVIPLINDISHPVATFSVSGGNSMTIDLTNSPNEIIDLSEEFNVEISIEIKDGSIRFLESDCPDKVCVNGGFISKATQTVICIPNKSSIIIADFTL